MDHIKKGFWILVAILISMIAFYAKDIHSKINNGVFVHRDEFKDSIITLKLDRQKEIETVRREICERLKRVESNQDEILKRLKR